MKTGFIDQGSDSGDVFATKDWLIQYYPGLATDLLSLPGRQIKVAGNGYAGVSPWTQTGVATFSGSGVPTIGAQWASIARNGHFAIQTDGTLWSWGGLDSNFYGLYGTNNFTTHSSPVQVASSEKWKMVARGGSHAMGITTDGRLYGWGLDSYWFGDYLHNESWTQISTVESFNSDYALAIRSDGTLWGWGTNPYGLSDSRQSADFPIKIADGSWSSVAATASAAAAIRSDGALFVWGYNDNGVIGQNDTVHRSSPTQVGTSSWTSVSLYHNTILAIRSDGTLWGWGYNGGALGLNNSTNYSSPVQVGTSSWTQVKTFYGATAAIRSGGALFMWGSNDAGQLGQNDRIHRSSPVQVGTSSWTQVSLHEIVAAAIRNDGRLFVWGYNNVGQLGLNDLVHRSSPVQIDATTSWTSVTAYNYEMFGIKSNGTLWSWGSNVTYNLGQPTYTTSHSWTAVHAGVGNVYAIRSDGALFAWGDNSIGQLGTNDLIHRSSPVQIGTSSWSAVMSLQSSVAAIRSDGALFTWGQNREIYNFYGVGYLGDGLDYNRSSPVQISTSSFTQLSTGRGSFGHGHFLALAADGAVWAWGYAKLMPGTGINAVPKSWTQVASHAYGFGAAIRSDGRLFVWGANAIDGVSGLGDTYARDMPTAINKSSWTTLAVSQKCIFAIRSDGALYAWGDNQDGQLGQSDLTHRSSPVQIGTSSWTKVAATAFNAIAAIRSDGRLFTWGYGGFGETGRSTTASASSPIAVSTTTSWNNISGGYYHFVATRSDNSLYAWGRNNSGQLGQNNTTNYSSPVQIGTSSWSVVSAGYYNSAAIRTDGRLFLWGDNFDGQLGQSDLIYRSSPVQIDATTSWTAVAAHGQFHAIRSNGTLWAWGWNQNGGLGLNDRTHRSSPVQVGSSSWTTLDSGESTFPFAIRSDGALFALGGSYDAILGIALDSDDPTIVLSPNRRSSPVQLDGGSIIRHVEPVKVLNASWTFVAGDGIGIKSDNTLWTWGEGNLGQFGDNTVSARRSSPGQVGSSTWNKAARNLQNAVAIRSDGTIWSWGYQNYGELGTNEPYPFLRSSPVQIGTLSGWIDVVGQDNGYKARYSGGTLWAWGLNSVGQLGDNTIMNRSSPVQIGASSWNVIGSARYGSIAGMIKGDGSLWTTGFGSSGESGTETFVHRSSPVLVGNVFILRRSSPVQVGSDSDWVRIADTYRFFSSGRVGVVGIKNNNQLWCWGTYYLSFPGANYFFPPVVDWSRISVDGGQYMSPKQLGAAGGNPGGKNYYFQAPQPMAAGSSRWSYVDINSSTTAVIDTAGRLYVSGPNNFGQLGQNNTLTSTAQYQRQQIAGSWSTVSVGRSYMLGIKSNGTMWAWGINTHGQLGLSDNVHRSSPTQIGTDTAWRSVVAGLTESAAIDYSNRLFTWGNNTGGVLGDGTRTHRSSPVQIGNAVWSKVAVRSEFTGPGTATTARNMYALAVDGTVWGWGDALNSQLNGLGQRSSPSQLSASLRAVDVAAGRYYDNMGGFTEAQVYVITDGGVL